MNDYKRFEQQLSALVKTPSVSCSLDSLDMSNKSVVTLLANWLEDLGFNCKLLPIAENVGKYNLVASIGQGSQGLVLSGHSDTVPYNAEKWQQDPFILTEKHDRFYGLGATDMKGFFPVVLAAVEQLDLKNNRQNIHQPLTIIATADEESSMSGARALTSEHCSYARCAIIGEPTSLKPIRLHKGIMMETVRVTGKSGHSSNPQLGNSALETMHEVLGELIAFRAHLQQQYQHADFEITVPTLNLGCIHGGDNPNRICGHCELQFDLRPLPGMNLNDLRETIRQKMLPIAQKHDTKINVDAIFPGVESFEQASHSDIVTTAEKLSGYSAQSVAFATEAPFYKALDINTIVMGPGSIDQAHQPDEYLALEQINPAIKMISSMIKHYCLTPK